MASPVAVADAVVCSLVAVTLGPEDGPGRSGGLTGAKRREGPWALPSGGGKTLLVSLSTGDDSKLPGISVNGLPPLLLS